MDNDDLDEGEVDEDAKDNLKATILVFFSTSIFETLMHV
jgi:hypothetical protein